MIDRISRDRMYEYLLRTLDGDDSNYSNPIDSSDELIGFINTIGFILDNDAKHHAKGNWTAKEDELSEFTLYIYRCLIFLKTDHEFIPLDLNPFLKLTKILFPFLFKNSYQDDLKRKMVYPFLNENSYLKAKAISKVCLNTIQEKMTLLLSR